MKLFTWFFRPRTVWCPTLAGWTLILCLLLTPFSAWWIWGESFLCLTQRQATDILVVEGWTGTETFIAAAAEFSTGGYRWIIATGGPNGESWRRQRWSYAEIAEDGLVAAGIARANIIAAPAREVGTQRTHESALAVQGILAARGLHPNALTIFTRGAHARRSRLVYAKVFEPNIKIGVISWLPPGAQAEPWWRSTVRAKDLLTETIGCLYEALLDSGRSTTAKQVQASYPSPALQR